MRTRGSTVGIVALWALTAVAGCNHARPREAGRVASTPISAAPPIEPAPMASSQGEPAPSTATKVEPTRPEEVEQVSGIIEAYEITTNKKFVVNKGFRGHAYMMFDLFSSEPAETVSTPIPEDVQKRVQFIGGDGFHVFESGQIYPTGGLLLGRLLLFDARGTSYGIFRRTPGNEAPRYFSADWASDLALFVKRNPTGFPYASKNHAHKITVVFGDVSIDIAYVRNFCIDANVLRVVLRDARGGSLVIKDVRQFGVIEHDADADGTRELYLLNGLACGRWLRVIKVVPGE